MNVDLITREEFERFKTEIINEIRMSQTNNPRLEEKGKTWLKSSDVRKLLNISIGTLQNLRLNGTIPFSKIGGLLYYKYEDILKLMDSKTDTD
nr:helix-turn-helix domain-containing protein [uncultured Flavobacterium sp.]